jgi:hypothetical protein
LALLNAELDDAHGNAPWEWIQNVQQAANDLAEGVPYAVDKGRKHSLIYYGGEVRATTRHTHDFFVDHQDIPNIWFEYVSSIHPCSDRDRAALTVLQPLGFVTKAKKTTLSVTPIGARNIQASGLA